MRHARELRYQDICLHACWYGSDKPLLLECCLPPLPIHALIKRKQGHFLSVCLAAYVFDVSGVKTWQHREWRTFQNCKFKCHCTHLFIFEESSVYVLHQQAIRSSSGLNVQLHNPVCVSANIQTCMPGVRSSIHCRDACYHNKLFVVFLSRFRKWPEMDLD